MCKPVYYQPDLGEAVAHTVLGLHSVWRIVYCMVAVKKSSDSSVKPRRCTTILVGRSRVLVSVMECFHTLKYMNAHSLPC